MSTRFKVELLFASIMLTWLIVGVACLLNGVGLHFLAGWIVGAIGTSLLECMPFVHKRVTTWEHAPWYFTFGVHFCLPFICLFTLRHIPQNYRDWKATPKPRCKNYSYPRSGQ